MENLKEIENEINLIENTMSNSKELGTTMSNTLLDFKAKQISTRRSDQSTSLFA